MSLIWISTRTPSLPPAPQGNPGKPADAPVATEEPAMDDDADVAAELDRACAPQPAVAVDETSVVLSYVCKNCNWIGVPVYPEVSEL